MYESDKTFPGPEGMIEYHNREEKWRHVTMVAKFLDLNTLS